jgi:Lrp/AsnC family transcriptional regulator for asnA, asnC and gidA
MPKKTSLVLDEIDLKILQLLQEDAKMGIQAIADNVEKGISTVHARVKKLEKHNIVKKYTAILDPIALGWTTQAFIFITLRYRSPTKGDIISMQDFCAEISEHPYVQSVYIVTGQHDLILLVRSKDANGLNEFILNYLRESPAVERTQTMLVMSSYHESLGIKDLLVSYGST